MGDEQTPTAADATEAGDDKGKQTPAASEPQDVASLPEWARKLITDTRGEAASYRTRAKEIEGASKATVDAIAKALGLKGDEADPAKLQDALKAKDAELRQVRVESKVRSLAGKNAADADALLDSRSFVSAVAGLDPNAADFDASLAAAIKAATDANPKLKLTQAASKGGAEINGGGKTAATFSRAQLRDVAFYRANEKAILEAQRDGRITD